VVRETVLKCLVMPEDIRIHVFKQFLCFAAVGAVGTLFHYAILIIMVNGLNLHPVIGSAAGFTVGALINYSLNYRITFRSNRSHRTAMPRFYLVAVIGLGINSLVLYILNVSLGFYYLLAQIITTGIVLLSNFILNKIWTFKEDRHVINSLPEI